MKTLKIFMALVSTLFLASFVYAGQIQIPAKYDLSKQLEEVHGFWKTRIIDWEAVDNQSLVIETSPGSYYLLVLTIPSYELPFKMNRIGITSSGSMIREGIDNVTVSGAGHFREIYPIDRIYKIQGSKEMRAVINQLQGQKDESHTY